MPTFVEINYTHINTLMAREGEEAMKKTQEETIMLNVDKIVQWWQSICHMKQEVRSK